MIAHRCSCFEENTAVFWKNNKEFPLGKRSDWDNRYKLCVTKLGGQIDKTSQASDFPRILLCKGKTPLDDNFIECEIFGPITARTLQSVTICLKDLRSKRRYWTAVRLKLESVGVTAIEK